MLQSYEDIFTAGAGVARAAERAARLAEQLYQDRGWTWEDGEPATMHFLWGIYVDLAVALIVNSSKIEHRTPLYADCVRTIDGEIMSISFGIETAGAML